MTPYQQQILDHLAEVATGARRKIPPQKAAAWDMAKRYAELDPYQLAEMPDLLKNTMLELHSAKALPAAAKTRG